MKRLFVAIAASITLVAEAASLTTQTSDAQVAAGATLAFACFQGPDLHLRFEQVPADQQIPPRSLLEVTDGQTSQVMEVGLRAFKLGQTQEVGVSLSATPVLGMLGYNDAELLFRLPQMALPLTARFSSVQLADMRAMARRCR